jgi:hypothetical protein
MKRYAWLNLMAILVTLTAVGCAKSRSSNVARPGTPAAPPLFDASGTGAGSYAGSELDPYNALDGMGTWEDVGDERYFVPDSAQLQDQDGGDWAPFQRGYWNYDEEKSWTWVSYDSFGWLTDHYGVWRHHSRHGWMWLPFRDRHYEAHTVTWFDEGNYVGWYPYFADYPQAYRHGSSLGFDDGYWDAYNMVARLNATSANFQFGITLINRAQFSQPNIRPLIIRDRDLIWRTAAIAHGPGRLNRVSRYPGGRRDQAFDFLQRYSSRRAPVGRAERIRSRGGAEIWQPHRTHALPQGLRRAPEARPQRPDQGPSPERFNPSRRDEPRREEFRRDLPRREDSRRDEPRREEMRREEPRRENPSRPGVKLTPAPAGRDFRPQVLNPEAKDNAREEERGRRRP